MDGILTPANIVVALIVVAALFFGGRRIAASFRGKSCCTDGESRARVKKVKVEDTDESHYPYATDMLIGGMSCEGCVENVQNALNALPDTWATVSLADKSAHIRAKEPIDEATCEQAVRAAGYFVPKL